jgi:outer membrane protein OmpA-like peptidoglycan-associated protein
VRRGNFPVAATLIAILVLAGCASAPVANNSLEEARAAYRLAADDPQVRVRAPVELALAERSLAQAERSWRDGKDAGLVAHQAYLAEQRSRIAQKTAQYRSAEATVATSSEQRNRIVLDAREREAAVAKAQARAAQLALAEAQKRAQALEQADAQVSEPPRKSERQKSAELAAELRSLKSQVADLKAQQTGRGWVLTLRNDLLFDSGGATLKPGAQRVVDNLAQLMRRQPDRDIAIEGFTDSAGSIESNRKLSAGRAAAVKSALVARGIEPGRIDSRGYGPAFPVASNDTSTGRQLNRRVEIVINPS